MEKCRYCGFEIEEGIGYCSKCGAKIDTTVSFAEARTRGFEEDDNVTGFLKPEKSEDDNSSVQNNPIHREKIITRKRIVVVLVIVAVIAFIALAISEWLNNTSPQPNNPGGYSSRDYATPTPLLQDYDVPTCTPVVIRKEAKSGEFYVSSDDNLYYYAGYAGSEPGWWLFNKNMGIWVQSALQEDYYDEFLYGLSAENAIGQEEELKNWLVRKELLSETEDIKGTKYDLFSLHDFIDVCPQTPKRGYYVTKNGDTYYFLGIDGAISMGVSHLFGWYYYDVINGWRFITDGKNKIDIGDELWYNHADCYAGAKFNDYKVNGKELVSSDVVWNAVKFSSDFSQTEEYKTVKSHSFHFDE